MSLQDVCPVAPASRTSWQAAFLALLPAIDRQARQELHRMPARERDEALQAALSYAAVAYARLVELNKAHVAFAGSLARYGLKQYRAGRLIGGRSNSKDVSSTRCQRRSGFVVEPLDAWQECLAYDRGATPAEIAALRIDFSAWLHTLSRRNRQLASALARGEETSVVATMFQITAGRVSQLRRELYESWRRFVGEPVVAPA